MAITMPKIDITFEQRAVSLIGRSERGVAILIVRDDTNKTFTHKQYSDLSAAQADESLYTADNYAAICDMLGFAPYQAHVFRCDADGTNKVLFRVKCPNGRPGALPTDGAGLYALQTDDRTVVCIDSFGQTVGTAKAAFKVSNIAFEDGVLVLQGENQQVKCLPTGEVIS